MSLIENSVSALVAGEGDLLDRETLREFAVRHAHAVLREYDPDQPRVPKGSPNGGQWAGYSGQVVRKSILFRPTGGWTWGRGMLHMRTGEVYTWPETFETHAEAKWRHGLRANATIDFDIRPDGSVDLKSFRPDGYMLAAELDAVLPHRRPLYEQAILLAETIIKVPTKSGNPFHDTDDGRFSRAVAAAARFLDTRKDIEVPRPVDWEEPAEKQDTSILDDEDRFAAIFNFHDPTSGLTAEVDRVDRGENKMLIAQGSIFDSDGTEAGEFQQSLEVQESGEIVAWNDLLRVAKRHQHKGFGHAFFEQAERAYRQAGIKKIYLNTGLEEGGFTWAAAGWLSRPGSLGVRDENYTHEQRGAEWARLAVDKPQIARALDYLPQEKPQLAPLIAELRSRIASAKEIQSGKLEGKITMPFELAWFGKDQPFEWDGVPTFLGKWILSDFYGSDSSLHWGAVRYL